MSLARVDFCIRQFCGQTRPKKDGRVWAGRLLSLEGGRLLSSVSQNPAYVPGTGAPWRSSDRAPPPPVRAHTELFALYPFMQLTYPSPPPSDHCAYGAHAGCRPKRRKWGAAPLRPVRAPLKRSYYYFYFCYYYYSHYCFCRCYYCYYYDNHTTVLRRHYCTATTLLYCDDNGDDDTQ